jgi:hypothetical protein
MRFAAAHVVSSSHLKNRYLTRAAIASTRRASPIRPKAPIPHIMSGFIISRIIVVPPYRSYSAGNDGSAMFAERIPARLKLFPGAYGFRDVCQTMSLVRGISCDPFVRMAISLSCHGHNAQEASVNRCRRMNPNFGNSPVLSRRNGQQ